MATLTKGLRLSELSSMSDEQRDEALTALFQAACNPTPEQLQEQWDEMNGRIRSYESRYKMSSADMKQKLARQEIQETADICSWLMLLTIKDDYKCQH